MAPPPPKTPDGRYIVVRERLWRASNPHLAEADRAHWVHALMAARLDVKKHLHQDAKALKEARGRVQQAKEALGERGDPWWTDGAPCFNRYKVHNTPYADWFRQLTAAQKPHQG